MAHSAFSARPFQPDTSDPQSEPDLTPAQEQPPLDPPANDQQSGGSLLAQLGGGLSDDANASMQGRDVGHALARLKGATPVLNALASANIDIGSQQGVELADSLFTATERIAHRCIDAVGADLSHHSWALPMATTILMPAVAKRWESHQELTADEIDQSFAAILPTVAEKAQVQHFGDDWDSVQPQVAASLTLFAAVERVMDQYDRLFNFFRDREDVAREVTAKLVESSQSMLASIESSAGELTEPSRTRTYQALVREGGDLMQRLWPEAGRDAIAHIKTMDRHQKTQVIRGGGYPLDGLMSHFDRARQVQASVVQEGLAAYQPAPDRSTSPGMG